MFTKKTIIAGAVLAVAGIGSAHAASFFGSDFEPRQNLLDLHRQISLDLGSIHQDYKETASGSTLNSENGWLPTAYLSGSWVFNNHVYAGADITYSFGHTDYDGQTWAGTPVTSQTDNDIVSVSGKIGYAFLPRVDWSVIPYLTYGYRHWDRNLQGEGGYDEDYSHHYIGAGVMADHAFTSRLTGSADVMVGHAFGSHLKAHFSDALPGLSDVSTNLGNKWLVRAKLGLDYAFRPHWHMLGAVQYTHFSYGHSDNQTLYYNGTPVAVVQEPKSRTNQVGLSAGVRYVF